MEALYLLRHKRLQVHGPFSKSELKAFFDKHHPLEGWEIGGTLGPWIALEEEERFKTAYPELWKELSTPSSSWKSIFSLKK